LCCSTLDLMLVWQMVFKLDLNLIGLLYCMLFFIDVDICFGIYGYDVFAVFGWWGGTVVGDTVYNGFYVLYCGGVVGIWIKVSIIGIVLGFIGWMMMFWVVNGINLFVVVEDFVIVVFGGVFWLVFGLLLGLWI